MPTTAVGVAKPGWNPLRLALYVALFPQLVAGPILRYAHMAPQIADRTTTVGDFAVGVRRFIVGFGNGLLLGYLMYTSGLVPRRMALLGLIGGPLIIASGIAVLFDVFQQGGTGQSIATIPEFLWELSLGIYLTVKGFKPSPILNSVSSRA